MARTGTVYVDISADTSAFERRLSEVEELMLRMAVTFAPEGSQRRIEASHRLVLFYTEQSAKAHRRYAAHCSKWDPRRWKALWDARRCERELAEMGEDK